VTSSSRRFEAVDALRAIAALSIVVLHACVAAPLLQDLHAGGLAKYVAHLDVGVTIFFLISGFLLYRPFARARLEGDATPDVRAYAWRRFLRITPAYWAALTVIALWVPLSGVFGEHGWRFFGFAQIYDGDTVRSGLSQAWTLCVEVTFYAMVPIYAVAMRRVPARSPRRWLSTELGALAALVVLSVAWKLFAISRVDVASTDAAPWMMSLPALIDYFALGMGLAVLTIASEANLLRGSAGRLRDLIRRRMWLPWLVAAVAFVVAGEAIGKTGEGGTASVGSEVLPRHALYAVVALGVMLPALMTEQRRALSQRVLRVRALRWIGLISYSIYLWHFALEAKLVRAVSWHTPAGALALFALMVLVSIGVGAVSYYVIERPPQRWGRRVRRRQAPGDQPGASSVPVAPTGG
jgi:peptidoglycan/LPS O-acetylase OafA/YrhL